MANNIEGEGVNWEDRVHPELKSLLKRTPVIAKNFDSWWKVGIISALMHIPGSLPPGVKVMKVKGIGAYFYPSNDEKDNPNKVSSSTAIMWVHGGGRVMGSGSGATEYKLCSRIVGLLGVPVLSAHYRLAPRHPFPAALDDIHEAYVWLARHVESKSGETGRIAVAGESAGSGLAAELCQRLLDESNEQRAPGSSQPPLPLPACQLLFYPMLHDRTCVNESLINLPPHITWNIKSNIYGWTSYLGPNHAPGDEELPKYAAASRREDLSHLPPAFILVGDLDLFHAECKEYAYRLKEDGVETEFVEVKGGYHGMMAFGENEPPIVDAWDRFCAFGKKFLFD